MSPERDRISQGVKTKAVRDGDHYVINGSKTFITNGYHADLICLVAKTDPSQGAKGTSLIMVETRDLEGFRRGRILEKIGQKGQDTAELFFDDARVPVANLLGAEEGKGFYQLMEQLPWERLMIGIYGVAVMEAAVEETVRYVKERKAFEPDPVRFPEYSLHAGRVQDRSAHRAGVHGQTASNVCWRASWMPLPLPWRNGGVRKSSVKSSMPVCNCTVAMVTCWNIPSPRCYADSRVQRIYGGSNEIMKELIARSL